MVGRLSTKFLLCLDQSVTASKRKSLQTEPFWHLLNSPRLSTRSGTLLCFINSSHLNSPVAYASLYADHLVLLPRPAQSTFSCPTLPNCSRNMVQLMETSSQSKEVWVLLFLYRSSSSHFPALAEPPGLPSLVQSTLKFLGVTFDRTLFFGAHIQSLCSKFYPCHKAFRSIATASWGPTKESLSLLYKAFVRLVLTYGWIPFLCNTATNPLAQLPSLKLTLEHQDLSSFGRALRLPPDFSSLYALATRNVPCRLKKKPSCRSFCSSAT